MPMSTVTIIILFNCNAEQNACTLKLDIMSGSCSVNDGVGPYIKEGHFLRIFFESTRVMLVLIVRTHPDSTSLWLSVVGK